MEEQSDKSIAFGMKSLGGHNDYAGGSMATDRDSYARQALLRRQTKPVKSH